MTLPHLSRIGRRTRLFGAAASLAFVAGLAPPASADTNLSDVSKDLDSASTLTSTFDVFGVPEVSSGLKLASLMVGAGAPDSTQASIDHLQAELDAVSANLASLKMRVANDESLISQQAYQLAVSWNNNGMVGGIREKKDGVVATMADLLALEDLTQGQSTMQARLAIDATGGGSDYGRLTPEAARPRLPQGAGGAGSWPGFPRQQLPGGHDV